MQAATFRHPYHRRRPWVVLVLLTATLLTACDTTPVPPTPASLPLAPQATAITATSATSTTVTSPDGSATPSPTQDVSTQVAAPSPTTQAATGVETPNSSDATPATREPSSRDKIDAAEKQGKLDHDTALLYQVYASFQRDKLPAEYQGDDSIDEAESGAILGQLASRFDSLSPAVKAGVAPFLLRPDDKGSFWNHSANTPTRGTRSLLAASLALAQAPSTTAWVYADSEDSRTRVWYPQPEQGEGLAPVASKLAQEIDSSNMWVKERRVMLDKYEPCPDTRLKQSGGDNRLDIYLVDPGLPVPRDRKPGEPAALRPGFGGDFIVPQQVPGGSCPLAGFVLLNSSLDFKALKSYMAHELFHAFQGAVTVKLLDPQWLWWAESSATWAMHLVYPTANYEHEFIVSGEWAQQRIPSGPLTCPGRTTECNYGAYLWPYFLTQGGGAVDEYIGRLWEASKEKAPIDVMAGIDGWGDQWKKFAYWNWNEGPADMYSDPGESGGPGHIAELTQMAWDLGGRGNRISPGDRLWPGKPLDLGQENSVDINLAPASFYYYVTGTPSSKSGVLHFDFGGLTSQEGAAVQAIVTIGNPAKPNARFYEDWTHRKERNFCLDRPDEYATNVIVVVSNSRISPAPGTALQGKLSATAKQETCPNSSNLSFDFGGSYTLHSAAHGATVSGQINTHENVQSAWQLSFASRENDEIHYTFAATNQIDLHADARLSGNDDSSSGSVTAQLNRSTTTHNPTVEGDDGYGQKTFTTLGKQSDNTPQPKQPGTLVLTKRDGKDAYYMTFGMTPALPDYTYHSVFNYDCYRTYNIDTQDYDNVSFTEKERQEGNDKCFKGDANSIQKTSGPLTFGGITLDWRAPRPPMGSYHFITGYYDPKTGVIEGSETYSAPDCISATSLDPLAYFVGRVDSLLKIAHGGLVDTDGSATCRAHYTVHWRVELPKQP